MSSTEPPTRSFAERVDDLTNTVGQLEGRIAEQNRLRELRIESAERSVSFARKIAAGAICAALVAFVAAGFAYSSAHTAREALATSKESTQDARVGSCEQYNVQQDQGIASDEAEWRTFIAAIAPNPNMAIARRVDAFLHGPHGLDASAVSGHPKRVCTTDGIAKYLAGLLTPTTKGTP